MQKTNLEMKTVPLNQIKPYWRNPRKNDKAVGPVIQSIQRFGYCQPILVDKDMVVIAGHTRLKALTEMGIPEAQIIVLDLPPDKAKQYRIIDNKTSEFAKWAPDELVAELREFDNLTEDFQVFFKEDLTALIGADMTKNEVTEEKVDKVEEKLEEKFTEVSRQDQVQIICPECSAEFLVNRKDLLAS